MPEEVPFEELLRTAVARHLGPPGTLHNLRRLTGGATKTTWSFDADSDSGRRALILQTTNAGAVEPPADINGITPHLTAEQDAAVMRAAELIGVPAPHVFTLLDSDDHLGHGYLTRRIEGETLGARIVRDDRFAETRPLMAAQCGRILANIHRIDGAALPFLMRQDAADQIAAYTKYVDHYRLPLPALELGLRWASHHVPRNSRGVVLHGDFRNGNLIVGPDGIRCVLDWEIAQLGDPMQDLGWLCVKTWRFGGEKPVGGFGEREDLFAAYEKAGGGFVDPAHVMFWEAFGNIKWAIMCLMKGLAYTDGTEPISIEQCAIARRIEEPLWDFLNLIETRSKY
jgi:aminoglycoside phosphotransferase (APT) family kinase protein